MTTEIHTPLQLIAALERYAANTTGPLDDRKRSLEPLLKNAELIANYFDEQRTSGHDELAETILDARKAARMVSQIAAAARSVSSVSDFDAVLNKLHAECGNLKAHIGHFLFISERALLSNFRIVEEAL